MSCRHNPFLYFIPDFPTLIVLSLNLLRPDARKENNSEYCWEISRVPAHFVWNSNFETCLYYGNKGIWVNYMYTKGL